MHALIINLRKFICRDCCLSNEFGELKKFKPEILCKHPPKWAPQELGVGAGVWHAGKDVELTFTAFHLSLSMQHAYSCIDTNTILRVIDSCGTLDGVRGYINHNPVYVVE